MPKAALKLWLVPGLRHAVPERQGGVSIGPKVKVTQNIVDTMYTDLVAEEGPACLSQNQTHTAASTLTRLLSIPIIWLRQQDLSAAAGSNVCTPKMSYCDDNHKQANITWNGSLPLVPRGTNDEENLNARANRHNDNKKFCGSYAASLTTLARRRKQLIESPHSSALRPPLRPGRLSQVCIASG